MAFEAKRLVTSKVIFEARHIPIFDRNELLKAVTTGNIEDYDSAEEQGGALRFLDLKKNVVLLIQNGRFGMDFEGSPDTTFFRSRIKSAYDAIAPKLPKKRFSHLGVRFQAYYAVEYKLDELCELTSEKLLKRDMEIESILAKKLDDMLYVTEYTSQGVRCRFQCAPITRKQLWQTIQISLGKEKKFVDSPEVSLYLDYDRYVQDTPAEVIANFVETSHQQGVKTLESICRYIFG